MNEYQYEMLQTALNYAIRGWRVFPVSKSSVPIKDTGSHKGTTDENQIRMWWKQHPSTNIAICTGPESFWVIDIDRKNGKDGLESLQKQFPDLSLDKNTLIAKTPTEGIHLLFKWPDFDVNNAQGVIPGVDIRGRGGYIVVAPSTRKIDGEWKNYRWKDPDAKIPEPYDWALELLKIQKDNLEHTLDLNKIVEGIPSGERDENLFRYAWHLKTFGMPIDVARGFIEEASQRCQPPFDRTTAIEKVERAYATKSHEEQLIEKFKAKGVL